MTVLESFKRSGKRRDGIGGRIARRGVEISGVQWDATEFAGGLPSRDLDSCSKKSDNRNDRPLAPKRSLLLIYQRHLWASMTANLLAGCTINLLARDQAMDLHISIYN